MSIGNSISSRKSAERRSNNSYAERSPLRSRRVENYEDVLGRLMQISNNQNIAGHKKL